MELILLLVFVIGGAVAIFKIPGRAVLAAALALFLPPTTFFPLDFLIYIWLFLIFTSKAGLVILLSFGLGAYWGYKSGN